MKKVLISMFVSFIIMSSPLVLHAEDLNPGRCSMTIDIGKHTWENRARATGPCSGLVEGYYLKENGIPTLIGSVAQGVKYSGQTFKVGTPKVPYGESNLVVSIIQSKPSKEEDNSKSSHNAVSKQESKQKTNNDVLKEDAQIQANEKNNNAASHKKNNTEAKDSEKKTTENKVTTDKSSPNHTRDDSTVNNKSLRSEETANTNIYVEKSHVDKKNNENGVNKKDTDKEDQVKNQTNDLNNKNNDNTKDSKNLYIIFIVIASFFITILGVIYLYFRKRKNRG